MNGLCVIDRRLSAPCAFSWTRFAAPELVINSKCALAQSDAASLEQALCDASDPKRVNYGKHLTKMEAAAFVGPSNQTVATIPKGLATQNLKANAISPGGNWLSLQVLVLQANDLFALCLSIITHGTTAH
ncbi:hypothetical protein FOMPIDRAFT_1056305, partial [Fomitopsis schrenkii]